MGRKVHDLTGVYLKLRRAEEHIQTLRDETTAFRERDPKPFGFRTEIESGPGKARDDALYAVVREQPPASLGLIVGDVIQNVRSALDYLVYEFSSPENRSKNGTQFPICDTRAKFLGRRNQAKIAGIAGEERALIERTQPYEWNYPQTDHPLIHLREFSNRDKHRLLVPVIAAVSQQDTWMGCDNALIKITYFAGGPVEHDTAILSFTATPENPFRDMHVTPASGLQVEIAEPSLPSIEIVDFAVMLHHHVHSLISTWDRHGFLPPTDSEWQ